MTLRCLRSLLIRTHNQVTHASYFPSWLLVSTIFLFHSTRRSDRELRRVHAGKDHAHQHLLNRTLSRKNCTNRHNKLTEVEIIEAELDSLTTLTTDTLGSLSNKRLDNRSLRRRKNSCAGCLSRSRLRKPGLDIGSNRPAGFSSRLYFRKR